MWTKLVKKILKIANMTNGHCDDSSTSSTSGHCS